MDIDSKVILKTFNNEVSTPEDCDPSENYWLLIGKTGTIIKSKYNQSRLLIKFDESVSASGLHCHNEISNSLFILSSDLKEI